MQNVTHIFATIAAFMHTRDAPIPLYWLFCVCKVCPGSVLKNSRAVAFILLLIDTLAPVHKASAQGCTGISRLADTTLAIPALPHALACQ